MGKSAKVKRELATRVQSQLGGHTMFEPKDHWCREFYSMQELITLMSSYYKVWSWGISQKLNIDWYCLRLTVNGHHHKGFVFITVNGADLFDIFYTDKKNIIKFYDKDVYVEDLIDTIDKKIEYIPEYGNK